MTLKAQAEELGIKVDGRWSDERIQKEIDAYEAENPVNAQIEGREDPQPEPVETQTNDERLTKMADMVKRQFAGQASDLPMGERLARIRIAMRKHGYMDLWENVGDILNLSEKHRAYL